MRSGAFQALFGDGDEVVLPAPFWVSYADMLVLAGKPKIARPASQGFKLTAEQLADALDARSRGVILNSPSNPTGAAYTQSELQGTRRGPGPASRRRDRGRRRLRDALLRGAAAGACLLARARAPRPDGDRELGLEDLPR